MRKRLKFGLIAAFWALSTPVSVNLAQPLSHSPGGPNTDAMEDPRTTSGRGSHVSVKDFTKCDGVGDDYEGLQLAARSAAGGVLRFPDEPTVVCQISHPILLASGTTVRGAATLRPTPTNLSKPMLIQFAKGAANVTVEGMTIDGGGRDFPNTNDVVQAFGGDHLVVENVNFQHIRGTAFATLSVVTNSGVRKSRFTDIGNYWKTSHLTADRKAAIVFCCDPTESSHGNFAADNTLSDIGLDGMSVGNQHDFLASGNICRLSDGQLTARWENPQPTAFPACIFANHGNAITVVDNVISDAQGNGIDLVAFKDRMITGNQVTGSGGAGIGVFKSGNAYIKGNTVRNNSRWHLSTFTSGIAFNGNLGTIVLIDNVSTDDQREKTQRFGVMAVKGTVFADLKIDASNRLGGNAIGSLGGGLPLGNVPPEPRP
jgi:parallel beta-helix repeat protein